jgi:Holliday junction resolvase-like predicted endonuclease
MMCGTGCAIPGLSPFSSTASRWGSHVYPVKQAFEVATGIPRSAFTTRVARRHLAALGFEVVPDHTGGRPAVIPLPADPAQRPGAAGTAGQSASTGDWHTEAKVQAMVVAHLVREGWQIVSEADTASRQRGIDIVAVRETEELAIEVKGFPGRGFADPRRAYEQKRARPSTQATGWYGRAILAAMLTRSRRPHARSVIALPDFPRYRDLFKETAGSLQKCSIEVWWVSEDGHVTDASLKKASPSAHAADRW